MKGEKVMKLTILGIQGCGKGTQAKRIAKEYGTLEKDRKKFFLKNKCIFVKCLTILTNSCKILKCNMIC